MQKACQKKRTQNDYCHMNENQALTFTSLTKKKKKNRRKEKRERKKGKKTQKKGGATKKEY